MLGKWAAFAAGEIIILLMVHSLVMQSLLAQPEAGYIQLIKHFQELTQPAIKANLVIIGTSHSAHGINPRFLESEGVRVYNFGLSGAGPRYYYEWYINLMRRYYPKPQFMIMGVDWFIFDDKYLYRKLENDLAYLPWKIVLDKVLDRSFPIGADVIIRNKFAIMSNKEQILGGLFQDLPGAHPAAKFYKGFIPLVLRYAECNNNPINFDGLINSASAMEDFQRLLDFLNKDGIRLILVQTPELLSCRIPDKQAQDKLSMIIKQNGITYLNYNTDLVSSINKDAALYSTWGHLNEAGSNAFSLRLRKDLERICPDIYANHH